MGQRSILVALSVVVALSGGCGGSTKSEPTTALDALAKPVLLTLAELGPGWAEEREQVGMSWADTCNTGRKGRTGDAKTGAFSTGTGPSLSEEVAVFDTVQDASASLDSQPSIVDCMVKLINEGRGDTAQAALSNASFRRFSFPEYGDRTEAFRLKLHLREKGQGGHASEGAVTAYSVLAPFDTDALQLFVSKAAFKVQQGHH